MNVSLESGRGRRLCSSNAPETVVDLRSEDGNTAVLRRDPGKSVISGEPSSREISVEKEGNRHMKVSTIRDRCERSENEPDLSATRRGFEDIDQPPVLSFSMSGPRGTHLLTIPVILPSPICLRKEPSIPKQSHRSLALLPGDVQLGRSNLLACPERYTFQLPSCPTISEKNFAFLSG